MSQIDESSNGKQIDLPIGEAFEIRLPENRTTGFQWVLESGAKSVSSLLSDEVVPGRVTGESGIHSWSFRTERAGSDRIELSYRRPWEEEEKPKRSFAVDLRVS